MRRPVCALSSDCDLLLSARLRACLPTRLPACLPPPYSPCSLCQAVDATVQELSTRVPRLQNVQSRSDAMLAVYDGNGARFQKHIDNTARDGRRLTVLVYLNVDWKMEDGGALQIFPTTTVTGGSSSSGGGSSSSSGGGSSGGGGSGGGGSSGGGGGTSSAGVAGTAPAPPSAAASPSDDDDDDDDAPALSVGAPSVAAPAAQLSSCPAGSTATTPATATTTTPPAIATAYPLAGRLVVFYSESVPHAVLPTFAPRYAVTVWYYDSEERKASLAAAKGNAAVTKTRVQATVEHRSQVRLVEWWNGGGRCASGCRWLRWGRGAVPWGG